MCELFVLSVLTVAAAESAIGLAILVAEMACNHHRLRIQVLYNERCAEVWDAASKELFTTGE